MPWGFIIGCIIIYIVTYYFIKKNKWIDNKILNTIPFGFLICVLWFLISLIIWEITSPEVILNQPAEIVEINDYIILDERILYTTKDNQFFNNHYYEDFISIENINSTSSSKIEIYENCEYTSPIASFFFGDLLIPTYYKIYVAGD